MDQALSELVNGDSLLSVASFTGWICLALLGSGFRSCGEDFEDAALTTVEEDLG